MKALLITLCLILAGASSALPQEPTTFLTATQKDSAITRVCELLDRFYVIPETAARMQTHLRAQHAAGAFDAISNADSFATSLTDELLSVFPDRHLRLYIGPNPDLQRPDDRTLTQLLRRFDARPDNHGLTKVEILDGNVGYIAIQSVMYSEPAMTALFSALTLVSNTDALIIDLRVNRGGDGKYMAYLFSYFFDEPTHINSIYWRDRDFTEEYWTTADVSGKRLTDLPLYVLISKETFSGAEEFAYDLQALKRATIIGECSAGGAHPASTWVVYRDLRISIPYGRAINPITGTNWEGVGVVPDIETPPEQALQVAIEHATKAAAERSEANRNRLVADYEECRRDLETAEQLFENANAEDAEALVTAALTRAMEASVMNQSSINRLGYDYLRRESMIMAIAVFRFNVSAYPSSANAYDSLAEAYLQNGDRDLAITNYEKALEIDPDWKSARAALEEIRK